MFTVPTLFKTHVVSKTRCISHFFCKSIIFISILSSYRILIIWKVNESFRILLTKLNFIFSKMTKFRSFLWFYKISQLRGFYKTFLGLFWKAPDENIARNAVWTFSVSLDNFWLLDLTYLFYDNLTIHSFWDNQLRSSFVIS